MDTSKPTADFGAPKRIHRRGKKGSRDSIVPSESPSTDQQSPSSTPGTRTNSFATCPSYHRRRSKLPTGGPSPRQEPAPMPIHPSLRIEQHLGFNPADFSTMDPNPLNYQSSLETVNAKLTRLFSLANRKTLSVDSPSFTPGTLAAPKSSTITSQAVNAAPFTPRGLVGGMSWFLSKFGIWLTNLAPTPSPQTEPEPVQFNPAAIREFTPSQNYDIAQTVSLDSTLSFAVNT